MWARSPEFIVAPKKLLLFAIIKFTIFAALDRAIGISDSAVIFIDLPASFDLRGIGHF